MASSELAITDVFPMRKRRATGLTKPKTAKPQTIIAEEKLGEKSTEACSKTPGKSIQTPPGKQPLKTPTRQQFPNAIGRLRKTPRRIAEWGREFDTDSGPEITWDNNSPSPTKILQKKPNGIRTGKTADEIAVLIRKLSKGKTCPPVKTESSNLLDLWMQREDGMSCHNNKNSPKRTRLQRRSALERMKDRESRGQRITRKRRLNASVNGLKFHEELSKFIQNINGNAERCSSATDTGKQSLNSDNCQPENVSEMVPPTDLEKDDLDDFFMDDDDNELAGIPEESLSCVQNNVQTDIKLGANDRIEVSNGYGRRIVTNHVKCGTSQTDPVTNEIKIGTNKNDCVVINAERIGTKDGEIGTNRSRVGTNKKGNVENVKMTGANVIAGVINDKRVSTNNRGVVTSCTRVGTNRNEAAENDIRAGTNQINVTIGIRAGTNGINNAKSDNKFSARNELNYLCDKDLTKTGSKIVTGNKLINPNVKLQATKNYETKSKGNLVVQNGKEAGTSNVGFLTKASKPASCDKKVVPVDKKVGANDNVSVRTVDDCADIIDQLEDYDDEMLSFAIGDIPGVGNQDRENSKTANTKVENNIDDCEEEFLSDFGDDDDFEIQFNPKIVQQKSGKKLLDEQKTNVKRPGSSASPMISTKPGFCSKKNDPGLISDDLLLDDDDFDLIDDLDMSVPAEVKKNDHVADPICDIGDDFPEDSFCLDDVNDMPLVKEAPKCDVASDLTSASKSNDQNAVKRPCDVWRCEGTQKHNTVFKPEYKKRYDQNGIVSNAANPSRLEKQVNSNETKTNNFKFRNTNNLAVQSNDNAAKFIVETATNSNLQRNDVGKLPSASTVSGHNKDKFAGTKATVSTRNSRDDMKDTKQMPDKLLDISLIPKEDSSFTGLSDWDAGDDLIDDEKFRQQDVTHAPITSTQKYSNQDIERKKAEAKRKLQQNLIKQKQQRAAAILKRNRMKAGFK